MPTTWTRTGRTSHASSRRSYSSCRTCLSTARRSSAATLEAARGAFPGRRVVLAFQPHRYTRTRDLFEDFVRVLSSADVLLLAEVYAAGEAPILAADARSLARAVRVAGQVEPIYVEDIAELPAAIRRVARDGDLVLIMGAGSIGNVAGQLA